jgi:hypothetical protein
MLMHYIPEVKGIQEVRLSYVYKYIDTYVHKCLLFPLFYTSIANLTILQS